MNSKSIWLWLGLAAGLLGAILLLQRLGSRPAPGPAQLLPGFKAASVSSLQVQPAGQLEIRAERTNGSWQLTQPLRYPAQSASIENLLAQLEQLIPAAVIAERELSNRFNADEEYGFATPLTTLILNRGPIPTRLKLGHKTIPGDQVFLQVVGLEGIYVVDAALLKSLPASPGDWRDTTLLSPEVFNCERLALSTPSALPSIKAPSTFVLQRPSTNRLWRLLSPIDARADSAAIEQALQKLRSLRIHSFVSDNPKVELEAYGLQPPELELLLADGTNALARLQVGKSPTNEPQQVYARCVGQSSIVTVPKDLLAPWRASYNSFRDPRLFRPTGPIESLSVRAQDSFSLQLQASNSWRVLPQDFAADTQLVEETLLALSELTITNFVNDVLTPQDLPAYGLASPLREYCLKGPASPAPGASNSLLVQLQFGTNQDDLVYVRRTDENSVYAVSQAQARRLPTASWQLRQRRFWNVSPDDVQRVSIRQQGRLRELIRKGPYSWSLAPGSQGVIEELPIEESVRGLVQAAAVFWVDRGEAQRARYGFSDTGYQVSLELKDGQKLSIEFGAEAPSTYTYAALKLQGELWICEFPPALLSHLLKYLSAP